MEDFSFFFLKVPQDTLVYIIICHDEHNRINYVFIYLFLWKKKRVWQNFVLFISHIVQLQLKVVLFSPFFYAIILEEALVPFVSSQRGNYRTVHTFCKFDQADGFMGERGETHILFLENWIGINILSSLLFVPFILAFCCAAIINSLCVCLCVRREIGWVMRTWSSSWERSRKPLHPRGGSRQ